MENKHCKNCEHCYEHPLSSGELLSNIANCACVKSTFESNDCVCYDITHKQKDKSDYRHLQVPEPWNGNIDKAQVMFITINPSYDAEEEYFDIPEGQKMPFPTICDKRDLCSFFTRRFEKDKDGDDRDFFNGQKEKCWYFMNKWTSWIINGTDDDRSHKRTNYLKDHAVITDLVHCKSQKSAGVNVCYKHCAEKWLGQIVRTFAENGCTEQKYIVLVGAKFKKETEVRNTVEDIVENNSQGKSIEIIHFETYVGGENDESRKKKIRKAKNEQ